MKSDQGGNPAQSEDYWTRANPRDGSARLLKAIKNYWRRREHEEPGAFIKYHSNGAH